MTPEVANAMFLPLTVGAALLATCGGALIDRIRVARREAMFAETADVLGDLVASPPASPTLPAKTDESASSFRPRKGFSIEILPPDNSRLWAEADVIWLGFVCLAFGVIMGAGGLALALAARLASAL